MSKQAWRIKFEQWLAANGDEGMPGVADHLAILTRAASLVRNPGFKTALEKFLDEWEGLPEQKVDPILRRLFEDETITIAACDGSKFISDAKSTFKIFLDSDFERWGLNKCGKSTVASNVSIHEIVKDATFVQMFSSLGSDLDKLCLSQHQIISFCAEHCDRLRQDGYATFFLFKESDQFYVADVGANPGGLDARVFHLERVRVLDGGSRRRLVVPQLTV